MTKRSSLPTLFYEKRPWRKGFMVIGIDEVGRGAFAGPLLVGGVAFDPKSNIQKVKFLESIGINDSKKLKPEVRERLSKIIKKEVLFYSFGIISEKTINKVNVGRATSIGVRKVVSAFRKKFHKRKLFVLIDAFYVKYVKGVGLVNQKAIVHGDEISLSIAAASIIAKVKRDEIMKRLSKKFPLFGFEKNKGYGTEEHRERLKKYGITKIHRISFIRKLDSLVQQHAIAG